MTDRLSEEREAEIRNWVGEHDDKRDDAAAILEWGDARLLLAALDAARSATERLRGLGRVTETLRAIRERDQARADAVAIFYASSPDGYPDHGPGNYDEMRERVEGYRATAAIRSPQ